jgi:hypothetical protein
VKFTLWKHTRSPYELYSLLLENPRIPKTQIAHIFHVNPKTAETWWDTAVDNKIIIPPIFRRKSFANFRENFYFIRSDDPHNTYKKFRGMEEVTYCSVQTGFADNLVISKVPVSVQEEIVLSGQRSDYYTSVPPNCSFENSVSAIQKILQTVDEYNSSPSPLLLRKESYDSWDEKDERIFDSLYNNLRKPFSTVLKESGTYSDKIIKWFHNRDKFGHTITMFFPQGESSYQLTLYAIKTSSDSLLIELFSRLPTSSVFYRVGDFLMMTIYISFPFTARSIVRRVLSYLKKKELIDTYTNSIIEYSYRPD